MDITLKLGSLDFNADIITENDVIDQLSSVENKLVTAKAIYDAYVKLSSDLLAVKLISNNTYPKDELSTATLIEHRLTGLQTKGDYALASDVEGLLLKANLLNALIGTIILGLNDVKKQLADNVTKLTLTFTNYQRKGDYATKSEVLELNKQFDDHVKYASSLTNAIRNDINIISTAYRAVNLELIDKNLTLVDTIGTVSSYISTQMSFNVNALTRKLSAISSDVESNATSIGGINDKLQTLESNLNTTSATAQSAKTASDKNANQISQLSNDYTDNVNAINNAIKGILLNKADKDKLNSLSGNVLTLSSNMSDVLRNIASLDSTTITLTGNVLTLQSNVTTAQHDITSLKSDSSEISGNVQVMSNDITTIHQALNNMPSSITSNIELSCDKNTLSILYANDLVSYATIDIPKLAACPISDNPTIGQVMSALTSIFSALS